MQPDVIFIGAGPIGLLAAIQLKLRCPQKSILMFEKYQEPTRHHAMYVNTSSLTEMNRSNGFDEVLDSIQSKVIISDLERKLRAYATKIGIEIKYQEVTDVNKLCEQYPETQYIIGSGGLRGVIHPQIFNSENQISEPLRFAAEVKYKALGHPRSLNKLTELPGVLSRTKHLVSEYVGYEKDGVTPISLRIFVDEACSQFMKSATFKNPLALSDTDKIDPNLLKTILVYLNARKNLAEEQIQLGTEKISMITLSIYASKDFHKQLPNGKTIIKIGEEGFAVPFYRSFNDNVICIPHFVKSMEALFENKNITPDKFSSPTLFSKSSLSPDEQSPLDYYQNYMQKLINSETTTVHLIDSGIGMLETSTATSRSSAPMVFFSQSKLAVSNHGGKAFLDETIDKPTMNEEATARSCKKTSGCILV